MTTVKAIGYGKGGIYRDAIMSATGKIDPTSDADVRKFGKLVANTHGIIALMYVVRTSNGIDRVVRID